MQLEPVNIVQIAIASPMALAGLAMLARSRFRALGALLVVFAIHMVFNVVEEASQASGGILVTPAISLLYGPLFFFFVRGLIFKNRGLGLSDLWHLAPFPAAFAFLGQLPVIRVATAISLTAYIAVCVYYIWRFHRASRDVRSDAHVLRLNWIIAVFAGFATLTALDILRMMTISVQPPGFDQTFYAASLTAVAILFAMLTYYALNRPAYFDGLTNDQLRTNPVREPDAPDAVQLDRDAFEQLQKQMRDEKLYRQPNLTLFDLANATGRSERDLSRIINQVSGRNFCDYINGLRAEDAAERLTDPARADETILAIAFEAGFSSKSTFNAVFKRAFGAPPSVYRRKAQARPND